MKILVVDDHPSIREVCAAILAQYGFTPVLAENGLEALELYREMRSEIALILSDITMPVMGGVELVRNIFEIDTKANVILMTGFSARPVVPEDLNKLCAILQKPFSPIQLIEAVKKCLEYQEQRHPELVGV
jgi:DNA-binding NtrC family response regulator